jgi:glycosyltransferase involved in cell wall biosynthesis
LFENIYFRELGTGVLIAKSEEEFISQTRDLIINKEFRDRMAVEGEKVRQNLSIEKCAENYEKLYGSLIYGKNINS